MTRITATAGRMTVPLLVHRFLADYARNPVNLLILVLVPAGFVAGAAGSLAQISKLLSGTMAPGAAVQSVTAGWAAAFIAAIAALAPVFGRVAGVLLAFLIPFLDLGIAQDPMLHTTPPGWAHVLPGYGGYRILANAILTNGSPQASWLLIALAWLAGTTVVASLLFRRNMRTARATGRPDLRPGAVTMLAPEK